MNRSSYLLACATAIVLVAGAYSNSLHSSFHFDDSHVIENNLYLRSLGNISRYFSDAHTFSSLPQNATYRPLLTLSLALDWARGGGDPLPFHVTQIALLILTGALLGTFFTPIVGPWPALFAAALFSLHTANSETMNQISARSELLSTIGLLTSFVLYQRSPLARRTLLYLVPLVIGALAKAPLVVFAPLLFVYSILIEKQTVRRAFRTALPSLIVGVAVLVFLNHMNAPEWVGGGGSPLRYAITQPFVWLHYARLFILPLGLTADSDWTPFPFWYDTRAVAGYLFVGLLIYAIVRSWRSEQARPASFGLLWFAIALIPTSSFFPLAEVVNEHRIFFAYIGAVLIVAWGLARMAQAVPRTLVVTGAIALLLAHAAAVHARNRAWASEESLWSDVIAKSPANGRAWMNYGLTQMAKGRYDVADSSFTRAAALTPDYSLLEINRGIVDGALGRNETAESHFRRALALNPDANAHFFFGRWLVERGRSPEALPHLEAALRLSPGLLDARSLLLRLYSATEAEPQLQALAAETRRIAPQTPALAEVEQVWPSYEAAFHAGLTKIGLRDWLGSAHANRHALRLDPNSADAWNNLGWSLAQLGFRAEAADAYRRSIALQPANERAVNNLRLLDPQ